MDWLIWVYCYFPFWGNFVQTIILGFIFSKKSLQTDLINLRKGPSWLWPGSSLCYLIIKFLFFSDETSSLFCYSTLLIWLDLLTQDNHDFSQTRQPWFFLRQDNHDFFLRQDNHDFFSDKKPMIFLSDKISPLATWWPWWLSYMAKNVLIGRNWCCKCWISIWSHPEVDIIKLWFYW